MKYLLFIFLMIPLFAFSQDYILSDVPIKGVKVVSESQGEELSFPVLDTKYNRENPKDFSHYFYSRPEDKTGIRTENISVNFPNIEEELEELSELGYKGLEDIQRKGLALYYIPPDRTKKQ